MKIYKNRSGIMRFILISFKYSQAWTNTSQATIKLRWSRVGWIIFGFRQQNCYFQRFVFDYFLNWERTFGKTRPNTQIIYNTFVCYSVSIINKLFEVKWTANIFFLLINLQIIFYCQTVNERWSWNSFD